MFDPVSETWSVVRDHQPMDLGFKAPLGLVLGNRLHALGGCEAGWNKIDTGLGMKLGL